jgi:predicted amidophosphoribosyltransferase
MPLTFTHWFDRGYSQNRLLADQIASILNRPVIELLTRSSDLGETQFHLKARRAARMQGKTVLLVDDLMKTGSALRSAADALWEGEPKAIYGLTFTYQETFS